LLGLGRDRAAQDRNTGIAEDLLALKLVDFHRSEVG
jgi:hypothetical protein